MVQQNSMPSTMDSVQQTNGKPSVAGKCCVCLEEHDYRGTTLVQCARCAIQVHVKCYGKTIPTDGSSWLCEACDYMEKPALSGEAPHIQPSCVVCPVEGGALRLTNQPGVWCHVLCMNWIPELSHSLSGEMNEVLDVRLLDRSRESLKCLICGLRGGCIQCISGRCARAFHVVCAMRAPSDVIFTGYNLENQQVYHCKTHSSDIATFKYEMVDSSWKRSPLLLKFVQEHEETPGKCRVCSAKIPPKDSGRHETLCLIGWLAREEAKQRKLRFEAHGLSPPTIDYSQVAVKRASGVDTKDHSGSGRGSSHRKHGQPMRPCPQCGQLVKETKMMSHMKSGCKRGKNVSHSGKGPSGGHRSEHSHIRAGPIVDLTGDEAPPPDLSDVLFGTWPGQNAGSLLDSTNMWKIVNNNFFSTKVLLKKRMEPLCKNLCGARLEDMGDFMKGSASHDAMTCTDNFLFTRNAEDVDSLALNSIIHRCDSMMRSSRARCPDDLFVKPLVRVSRAANNQDGASDVHASDHTKTARIRFSNNSGDTVSCELAFHPHDGEKQSEPHEVWTRYHPDQVSGLSGAGLENVKPDQELWLSLRNLESSEDIHPVDSIDDDELTPEASLLIEKLREQMRQNRFRMRSLCRRTQQHDVHDEIGLREKIIVENYYKDFAFWKALSRSLLFGYQEFWKLPAEESNAEAAPAVEEEDEPVDDGTCVVCFDGQSPESNPIIFCDRCDLAVHIRCYGMQYVPSNDFYCDRCQLEDDGRDPAAEVYCQLCPLRDGAFKKTIDGKWVHVVCALWCPGVWIGNLQTLADIKLVDSGNRSRFQDTTRELRALIAPQDQDKSISLVVSPPARVLHHGSLCQYCRVACGRTIKCCYEGCPISYHPLCGWFEGNAMIINLDPAKGYVYNGGGSGLLFEMYCGDHLPDGYSSDMRVKQRKNRRRFRIDSFFKTQSQLQPVGRALRPHPAPSDSSRPDEWVDKELCGACFNHAAPARDSLTDATELKKRQLMLRCQYCNTFVHASCSLSELDDVSDLFRSNWICERCTLAGQGKYSASTSCVVCDRSSDYMMPCAGVFDSQSSSASNNGSPSGHNGTSTLSSDRWIHVLCAKVTKAKMFKRHQMLCAGQPSIANESSGRCDLCQTRGRNLAGCRNCSKRFHPTCAMHKKYYVQRSNKADWKFYCPVHPPSNVVYDELHQSWFTGDILAHLRELRHQLERGRMIIEMARQRDRQRKRLLNLCTIKKMELSVEMILKKRPTPIMKDAYFQYTGAALENVPKREAPAKKAKEASSRKRSRTNEDAAEHDDGQPRRSSRVSSADTIKSEPVDEPSASQETPRKIRRVAEAVDVTPTRRSSRRGGATQEEIVATPPPTPTSERAVRASSRSRSAPVIFGAESADPVPQRRRNRALDLTPDEFEWETLADVLQAVTRRRDFDDLVPELYPEMAS